MVHDHFIFVKVQSLHSEYFSYEHKNDIHVFIPNYEKNPFSDINTFLMSGAESGEFGTRKEVIKFLRDFEQDLVLVNE